MSADAMLRSLNDTDWRWLEQGKEEVEKLAAELAVQRT